MLGLHPNLMWCVNRVRTVFRDDIGNHKTGTGTGFWLSANGNHVFVTNRHNVDPALSFPALQLQLESIEIEMRKWDAKATPETQFLTVEDPHRALRLSPTADCAILAGPTLARHDVNAYPFPSIIKTKDIVTAQQFENALVGPMETALFIGFPGAAGQQWWDEAWNAPVARQCVLSSPPAIPFTNSRIATTDVVLVSGFSFSGASGSPVFLPARGFSPGGDLHDPSWRPALLIGLMSGHFWEPNIAPEMFRHTGLSYLTRSSAVLELLAVAGMTS